MIQDFERFENEFDALRKLFPTRVDAALPRLREIYNYTEERWHEYAAEIPEGVVRYVLIAEAPPWSSDGTPQFLLDPESRSRLLLGALQRVFPQANSKSPADTLKVLAKHGFLLLNSIPFAMDYSSKRSSPRYDDLLRLTARTYLQAKIDASPLTWSRKMRVAFAFKRNARAIIGACGGQLSFGGNLHTLSTEQIAANGAGYPDALKLRNLYEVDPAR